MPASITFMTSSPHLHDEKSFISSKTSATLLMIFFGAIAMLGVLFLISALNPSEVAHQTSFWKEIHQVVQLFVENLKMPEKFLSIYVFLVGSCGFMASVVWHLGISSKPLKHKVEKKQKIKESQEKDLDKKPPSLMMVKPPDSGIQHDQRMAPLYSEPHVTDLTNPASLPPPPIRPFFLLAIKPLIEALKKFPTLPEDPLNQAVLYQTLADIAHACFQYDTFPPSFPSLYSYQEKVILEVVETFKQNPHLIRRPQPNVVVFDFAQGLTFQDQLPPLPLPAPASETQSLPTEQSLSHGN